MSLASHCDFELMMADLFADEALLVDESCNADSFLFFRTMTVPLRTPSQLQHLLGRYPARKEIAVAIQRAHCTSC